MGDRFPYAMQITQNLDELNKLLNLLRSKKEKIVLHRLAHQIPLQSGAHIKKTDRKTVLNNRAV